MSIPTNCGDIDLAASSKQLFEPFASNNLTTGNPTLTNGNIKYFHNKVCTWAYSVPLKFAWVLFIYAHNKDNLLKQIFEIGKKYENNRWEVYDSAVATTQSDVQEVIGCIFAQGIILPGENIGVEYAGITEGSKRGFVNAPIITGRSDFEPLEIGFLETNRSFVDSVLRPWSIIVGHKGLIATDTAQSIKATIVVHQLSRYGTDKDSKIRKTFIFEDCAPINISAETLDYSSSSDFPKIQAKFSYSQYSINDLYSN
jgi:hypothetical protein